MVKSSFTRHHNRSPFYSTRFKDQLEWVELESLLGIDLLSSVEALASQLKTPAADIMVTVVDSKMDWLREVTLSLSSSYIRGDTTHSPLLVVLPLPGMPNMIERLAKVVKQMKELDQDPHSFVNSRTIRDPDTIVRAVDFTLDMKVICIGTKAVVVEACLSYAVYRGSHKMVVVSCTRVNVRDDNYLHHNHPS